MAYIYIWGRNMNQRLVQPRGAHFPPPLKQEEGNGMIAGLIAGLGRQKRLALSSMEGSLVYSEEGAGMA